MAYPACLAAVAGSRFRAADGRIFGLGAVRAQRSRGRTDRQPQWLLRAGLRDAVGSYPGAGATHTQALFFAARTANAGAAGFRGGRTDTPSAFSRGVHP